MTERRTAAALGAQDRGISLDAPADEGGKRALHEYVPGVAAQPDEVLMQAERAAQVREAMQRLNARDAEVISLTFGFGDAEPLPLSQVGQRFGISKERVRQIRNRAMRHLRAMLTGEDGYAN